MDTPASSLIDKILRRLQNKYPEYRAEKWQSRIGEDISTVVSGIQGLPPNQAVLFLRSFSEYIQSDNKLQTEISNYTKSNSLGRFLRLWRLASIHTGAGRDAFERTQIATEIIEEQHRMAAANTGPPNPIGMTLSELCEKHPAARLYLEKIRTELYSSPVYFKVLKHITSSEQAGAQIPKSDSDLDTYVMTQAELNTPPPSPISAAEHKDESSSYNEVPHGEIGDGVHTATHDAASIPPSLSVGDLDDLLAEFLEHVVLATEEEISDGVSVSRETDRSSSHTSGSEKVISEVYRLYASLE